MKAFKQCINNLLDKNSLLKDDDLNSKKDIKQVLLIKVISKTSFYFHIVLCSVYTDIVLFSTNLFECLYFKW